MHHPLEVNALARRRNPVRAGSVPVREPTDNSGQQRTPGVRKNRSYTASQAPDLGWKERALWSSSLPTSTTRAWSATRPFPCPSASGPPSIAWPATASPPATRDRQGRLRRGDEGAGLHARVELVEVGPVVPPDEIVKRLQLEPGEQASSANAACTPTTSPCSSPPPTSPGRWPRSTDGRARHRPGGIYSRLADVGHGPVRFTEDVSARMPTPDEAEFLRITPPQPVFFLVRVAFDADGRPVETCEHIMAGDRWQLSYAWEAD